MLNFIGRAHRTCDGVSRRSFLRVGALGIGGLSLPNLLRYQAQAGPSSSAPADKKKAVILVWAAGGPSHIDMYDLKPDAPAEFRGEFKPISRPWVVPTAPEQPAVESGAARCLGEGFRRAPF